jgi:hypothetical protein
MSVENKNVTARNEEDTVDANKEAIKTECERRRARK